MDIVAFDKKEREIMEKYFSGTNAETAYRLGRYCGLRINECFGLKWSQIDLPNRVIHVRQQMQYQDGFIKLVPLKTKHARRDVYLSQKMVDYLGDLIEKWNNASDKVKKVRLQNHKMITDVDGSAVSSLELVNSLMNGKIQTVNSMKYHTREMKKLGVDFKYHYLRHTYGTLLAINNTPVHILCNQMGHAKIDTTQKYYLATLKEGISILQDNLERI